MQPTKSLQKAIDQYNLGDVDGAIAIVEKYLQKKSVRLKPSVYNQSRLFLGTFFRIKGEFDRALLIQEELSASCEDIFIRCHALIERSTVHRHRSNLPQATACLEEIPTLIDTDREAGLDSVHDKLLQHFFSNRGALHNRLGQHKKALVDYHRAVDHAIASPPSINRTNGMITAYLNICNTNLIIGNTTKSREYMILAHALIKSAEIPFAYGLLHFFEILAAYNLFAANSQQGAIDALLQISESVIDSFADFRKVFDFFSSIIVQLHEQSFDIELIRTKIAEYGDDPLIKAYLPALLAGSPPPGDDGDTTPAGGRVN